MSSIHEECGVFGIYSSEQTDVATTTYYGLFALQHRGQESCGIVVNDKGVFKYHKDAGLVNDIFTKDIIKSLGLGNIALGHVRYGTIGTSGRENAQPMVVKHIKGNMAIAYNGSLTNANEIREKLEMDGSIFHTLSDTEVIANVITKERINTDSIEDAISKAMEKLDGAYSVVIMSPTKLIAIRDKYGFRPLCYGKTDDGRYIVASESCALDSVGAKLIREIKPGEIVVFDKEGVRSNEEHCGKAKKSLCIFEYIYFARPDSIIEKHSVHKARLNAGVCLALEHPVEADVVIGVPDSGIDAAIGYARQSGIPYGIGFIKNKYIGRTFIAPGQKTREDKVRIKLNVVSDTVKGKRVVLIDDSIVRGTTCARIVKLLRDAGAKEVHMRVSAPPFLNPCYYGTDIDSRENLIACNHTLEEIQEIIDVDSLGFLYEEHLPMLIGEKNEENICAACFNNKYPTEIPKKIEKNKYDKKIDDKLKV